MKREVLNAHIIKPRSPYKNAVEVCDETQAVQKAVDMGACWFTMVKFEIEETEEGKEYYFDENYDKAPRRYVNVDRLYTPAEVVAELDSAIEKIKEEKEQEYLLPRLQAERNAFSTLADIFNKHGFPPAPLIHEPYLDSADRPYHEYIWLKSDEKAFDRNGSQIWPKPDPAP